MNRLNTIELDSPQPANASVIWLHGLGASADDFLPIVPQLNLPLDHTIRFIFPNAPLRPVSLNGGYAMPAWYDIYGLAGDAKQDELGIRQSEELVLALIAQELQRGIKAERIVLAGFSQGGAMALHTGLRYSTKLAGVLALSTYLPLADLAENELIAPKDLDILMIHGSLDKVVKLEWAEISRQTLHQLGYTIDWQLYPMAHTFCLEEVAQISQWLINKLLQT